MQKEDWLLLNTGFFWNMLTLHKGKNFIKWKMKKWGNYLKIGQNWFCRNHIFHKFLYVFLVFTEIYSIEKKKSQIWPSNWFFFYKLRAKYKLSFTFSLHQGSLKVISGYFLNLWRKLLKFDKKKTPWKNLLLGQVCKQTTPSFRPISSPFYDYFMPLY